MKQNIYKTLKSITSITLKVGHDTLFRLVLKTKPRTKMNGMSMMKGSAEGFYPIFWSILNCRWEGKY